jgi:phytoene dehydrogenase-like protein
MFAAFLDGQLLISAQTTADSADALYGSAALDLPRRGVNHVQGGIGSLAKTLADWIRANGGQVHYRQQVERIQVTNGRAVGVQTKKGLWFEGDTILANVTPWSLVDLLGEAAPDSLRQEMTRRSATWGAFTLYLGLKAEALPDQVTSHQQVITDANQPLGEGNSVFISLADPEDASRAPIGKLPATLSTHTAIAPWWRLFQSDRQAYFERRAEYAERMLDAAESAIPGIRQAIDLCLPGTPVTFDFFTRRPQGMVGGFPQTSLWSARGPRTGIANLWLVGDSIFPGQSTAGVTLGAMRVAADVQRVAAAEEPRFRFNTSIDLAPLSNR